MRSVPPHATAAAQTTTHLVVRVRALVEQPHDGGPFALIRSVVELVRLSLGSGRGLLLSLGA